MSRVTVRTKRRQLPYMKLKGVAELEIKTANIVASADNPDKIEPVLLSAAQIIERGEEAKIHDKTGNLRKGIRSTLLKRLKNKPAAGAGADYRIAPHAHLLERGTKERYWAKHPSHKYVGRGPAWYFQRDTVKEVKDRVINLIKEGFKRIIEGAV